MRKKGYYTGKLRIREGSVGKGSDLRPKVLERQVMAGKKRKSEGKKGVRTLSMGVKVKLVDRRLANEDINFEQERRVNDRKESGRGERREIVEKERNSKDERNSEDEGTMEVAEEGDNERGKELPGKENRLEQDRRESRIIDAEATETRDTAGMEGNGRKGESTNRSVMIKYRGCWRFIENIKEGSVGGNDFEYKRYQHMLA